MTETAANTHPGTARVERNPKRPVRHTAAGRITVPVFVVTDDAPALDADMVLTGDSAEALCEEIDAVLRGRADTAHPAEPRTSRTRRAVLQEAAFDTGNV